MLVVVSSWCSSVCSLVVRNSMSFWVRVTLLLVLLRSSAFVLKFSMLLACEILRLFVTEVTCSLITSVNILLSSEWFPVVTVAMVVGLEWVICVVCG